MSFLGPDRKLHVHIVALVLVVVAMGATIARIILAEMPMTRADTMALGAVSSALDGLFSVFRAVLNSCGRAASH